MSIEDSATAAGGATVGGLMSIQDSATTAGRATVGGLMSIQDSATAAGGAVFDPSNVSVYHSSSISRVQSLRL